MAAMSGSGSTCFALFHEDDFARGAAERIAQDHPEWWVSLTHLAGPDAGLPRLD
jgi:4-diphosphocytidyl-2-C-methyl-D-erythritol kinase